MNQKIGAIFTPIQWARFFVRKFNITKKWLDGATIFDPTMGEGNLIQAIIAETNQKNLPLHNLYGCELNKNFYQNSFKIIKQKYNQNLPKKNFYHSDIFDLNINKKFDIIIANPPWSNFTNLPQTYKQKIKPQFLKYNLATNKKNLLWGNARIDIAALIIQKTITDFLKENGQGYYFTPLSILFNDGAHENFRQYQNFRIENIYDFNSEPAFQNINTRYGFITLRKNKKQSFPIPCYLYKNNKWQKNYAHAQNQNSALSLTKNKTPTTLPKISAPKTSQPRQGINTCGANEIFFFDSYISKNNKTAEVANKKIKTTLPKSYLYPVLTKENFINNKIAKRWVLLPYDQNGKPLTTETIQQNKLLWNYLTAHQTKLQMRKGIIINTMIKRGIWWALLGVGAYNFAPYKIAWEAYGRSHFNPQLFEKPINENLWQANQSLQAFMPFNNLSTAKRILSQLQKCDIEQHLLSYGSGGTMSWAQPSRIKQFLQLN